jgi:hypothetical protein
VSQPNNVSAAGVLTDDLVERCLELEELATVGQSEQAALNRLAGTYRSDISPHDRKAMARNQTHHEAMRFVLAAASAQATAPVGWFVQRSSFGPWIEVERYEDGAVRLHRMDGDQATGLTVPEGYKLVPAEPTEEMVDAACPVGEVVDHFDMKMALRSGIAAAPAPAAREAGDGVSEVQPPAGLTEREQFIWNLGHSAAAGSLQDADRLKWLREHHFSTLTNEEIDQQIAADAALLREAGSR